jgi:hypothetical protein
MRCKYKHNSGTVFCQRVVAHWVLSAIMMYLYTRICDYVPIKVQDTSNWLGGSVGTFVVQDFLAHILKPLR